MKKRITIHIGEICGSAEPIVIHTLLGSCVAVCLFDPVKRIGAMNHIFLPGRADMKHFDAPARFSINAMELLINRMMNLGADRRRFTAKTFGGAHMFPKISTENGIGRKITEVVVAFLRKESIRLVNSDFGGRQGRQIYFHTDTGDVFVRLVRSSQSRMILSEEEKALPRIRREIKKPGPITLFD